MKNIWHWLKSASSDFNQRRFLPLIKTGKYFYPWIYFECACSVSLPCKFFLFSLHNLEQRKNTFGNEIIKYYILLCCISKYQDALSICKTKSTCYLQSWTPLMTSGGRCCYFIWCVIQTNVSHSHTTTPGCLHIAKKWWCLLVNHPSKDAPCLPVPEGATLTCTYFRRAKIIVISTPSYHMPKPNIQCIFHKVYVQGNIPQIIFTKLPCITAASERVSLYHFVVG